MGLAFEPPRSLGALLLLFAACSSQAPDSAARHALDAPEPSAPEEVAVADGTANASLAGRVEQLAARHARGWDPGELRVEGDLADRERRSSMAVLRYGRCYRFIGAGGPGLEDLDLVLYDSNNVPVQRDVSQDGLPILGLQAHICPHTTATYRLEVSAYAGSGPFFVRSFESPH